MKPVPDGLKSWVELIEKSMLVGGLFIGLVASGYKGYEFLSRKSENEASKGETYKLLIGTHENLVRNLDAQVSALDAELAAMPLTSPLWKAKESVRKMKAEDRRVLMFNLESQVFVHEETMAGKRAP